MEKKGISIKKHPGYKEHHCKLGIDKEKEKKFNEGKKITITEKELETIGKHRWLEVNYGS